MSPFTRAIRPYRQRMEASLLRVIYGVADPSAHKFYLKLVTGGFQPNALIDVLPQQRIIYVAIPKCGSSRIKMTLSRLIGNHPRDEQEVNRRKRSGLKSPKHVGLSRFYRMATDADALRFTFVRNPYARLVSAWADKFHGKPLVAGDPFVDCYLAWRAEVDPTLPAGPEYTLSFADFAIFASLTAGRRIDAHWQLQDDIATMPGIHLNLIGRMEQFSSDISRVLDFARAGASITKSAATPLNESKHVPYGDLYDTQTAHRVYGSYERDFDKFSYARAIPQT